MWDFETIDNADISEDSGVFEMEPLTEIKVLLVCVLHTLLALVCTHYTADYTCNTHAHIRHYIQLRMDCIINHCMCHGNCWLVLCYVTV